MPANPKMPPQITLGEGIRGMPYKNRIEGANEFERWMMNNDPEYAAVCMRLPGGMPPVERLLVVLSVMSSKAWHWKAIAEDLAERVPPGPIRIGKEEADHLLKLQQHRRTLAAGGIPGPQRPPELPPASQ